MLLLYVRFLIKLFTISFKYNNCLTSDIITVIIVPLQLVFFLSIFGNNILDILIPLNHTRPRTVPITIYYFVDQQKFFYFFGMHLNIISSFAGLGYIAIETISMAMIQHLCGLLKITR